MFNKKLFVRLVKEDEGQDLIEYAMLAAFVSLVAIVGATLLGIWVYPGFPTLFWGLSGFFVNDLMGKALWSSWKTRSVFQGAVGAFCASTAPSASTGPICMRQDRRVLGLQSTRE